MITFKDKRSGYEIKGLLYKKTDDCYAVADHDGLKLLRIEDWEEVRDGTFKGRVQDQTVEKNSTEEEEA